MPKSMKALALAVLVIAAFSLACSGSSRRGASKYTQKLVIIGFDGMDPILLKKWMDEGKLPNISALAKGGGMFPLQTTHSPESPTAWASFATGVNAGKHNIYDFLVRDTVSYIPDLGMVTRTPPKFLFNYFPVSKPKITVHPWRDLVLGDGRQGRRPLGHAHRPGDVPARRRRNGHMLSGLPLPDIRGTMGTFSYYATDLSRYEEGNTEMGGILKRLVFEGTRRRASSKGRRARSSAADRSDPAQGPDAERQRPREAGGTAGRAGRPHPIHVKWNRSAKTATIAIDGQTISLEPGKWSRGST
jgi:hypothetical protein